MRERASVIPSALPIAISSSSTTATISSPRISKTIVCQAPGSNFIFFWSMGMFRVVGPKPVIFSMRNPSGRIVSWATCSFFASFVASSSWKPSHFAPSNLKENWMMTLDSLKVRVIVGRWPSPATSATLSWPFSTM